jgi:hypothetical protein
MNKALCCHQIITIYAKAVFISRVRMAAGGKLAWSKLACSKRDLRLDITLKCGQSFRLKNVF